MKTALLLTLGALPGIALAYAALTGYILGQVKPAPIMHFPIEEPAEDRKAAREPIAA